MRLSRSPPGKVRSRSVRYRGVSAGGGIEADSGTIAKSARACRVPIQRMDVRG
jgi:hypothetical protein